MLEGAARVFDREGLGATTNRIAEAAGVSIGTLYEYFPDKESLLLALGERHLDTAVAAVRELAQRWETQPPATIAAVMRDWIELLAEQHRRHPSMHALLAHVVERVPAVLTRALQLQSDVVAMLSFAVRRLRPQLGELELRAQLIVFVSGEVVHGPMLAARDEAEATRWMAQLEAMLSAYLEHA
ncbi:MAG TPA: TetR/AcrR family transcriptional regulator [Nannocystaceae bacterium]|nr:TetR/AcrR family transcriptional regulator [Nannocystaceae bacterium]